MKNLQTFPRTPTPEDCVQYSKWDASLVECNLAGVMLCTVCFICCGCRLLTSLWPLPIFRLLFYQGWHSLPSSSLKEKWNICAGQARWLKPPGQTLSRATVSENKTFLQEASKTWRLYLIFSFKNILWAASGFILPSRFSQGSFVDGTHFHCGCILQLPLMLLPVETF